MHALKWWKSHTRMFFDGDGGGSASPPGGASSGGDGGGAVSAPAPAGDGGTTAAPAPDQGSPSSVPPASPEAPPAAPEVPVDPWASLGSLEDLDYTPTPPTPAKSAPVPPVAPEVKPPVAGEARPPAPPVVPTPAQPQPASDAPPVALSPSDPVGIANALEANRDVVMAHLAQTKFALSQEDVTELETDVVAAVPKIMSRVFIEAQMSMQKFLAQALPGMMKQYGSVTKANDDAEQSFFGAHKDLDIKNPQHRATAVRIASIYRKANPSIPLEQLISEVGPMVRASLQMAAPPASAAAPPVIPGQPKGGTPFRPAVNGGGGSSPAPAEQSEWAGLGQQFDEG